MTQSPCLPELPKPDLVKFRTDDGFVEGYTADQMNAHYLKGYEAGSAAAAQAVPGWIGVEDRLPDERASAYLVAVISKKTYSEGSNYPGMGIRSVVQDWVARNYASSYTHWMALPEITPAAPTQGAEGAAPADDPDAWKWETPTAEDLAEFDKPPEQVSTSGYLQTVRSDPTKLDWNDAPRAPAPQAVVGEASETLRDAIAASLGDLYVCSRVWEAWQVGTMSQDDFWPAWEDGVVIDNIAAAVRAALTPSPTPTAPQEADALREALQWIADRRWHDADEAADAARAALAQHQPQQGEQHE